LGDRLERRRRERRVAELCKREFTQEELVDWVGEAPDGGKIATPREVFGPFVGLWVVDVPASDRGRDRARRSRRSRTGPRLTRGPDEPPLPRPLAGRRRRKPTTSVELLRDALARVIRAGEALEDGDPLFAEAILDGLADDLWTQIERRENQAS
jgi:hypothetical protein